MSRIQTLLIGAVAVLAVAELFHGPLGRAVELRDRVEQRAQVALEVNEMTQVRARLADSPMRRTIILSGPADDFQREGLVRVMEKLQGVEHAEWDPGSLPVESRLPPGPPPENVLAPPVVSVPEKR
jgi:hypothetical protein